MSLAPAPRRGRPNPAAPEEADEALGDQESPQVWAVQLGDSEPFEVRDLPVGVLAGIARENSVTWVRVVGAPMSDIGVAEDVLKAVAKEIGYEDLPERITVRYLTDEPQKFLLVEDTIPASNQTGTSDPPSGAAT